ncbi:MAG: phosphotransferase [Motiliproteus sp.]|nr:phosphotransferase [Motiliproteus sp.]MCW9053078.1 phosphotransferase [Motiliproteus sp.]
MDNRQQALKQWISKRFDVLEYPLAADWQLSPVSGDASFRRYFRVHSGQNTWIAVDAPPEKEDSHPFVAISRAWLPLDIHCPEVFNVDFELGFMLLSDLGDSLYLDQLNSNTADELYLKAMQALVHIQQCQDLHGDPFPPYDRALLLREMELFRDWFVTQLLALELTPQQQQVLDDGFERLITSALEQPQVCVHRDYHSRNLMITDEHTPGVIDFQDAVWGPVSYDLVSLLRDCYIDWPKSQVQEWALQYFQMVEKADIIPTENDQQKLRWFDLMGMQRHLKAIGIFARLNIRDGKSDYLGDIPRTFNYLLDVSADYPEFSAFRQLLSEQVLPAMEVSGYFAHDLKEQLG